MARLAYIKSKLFIPNTPEMRRRVEKYYEFRAFKQTTCNKCDVYKHGERFNDVCAQCPAYLGHYKTWKETNYRDRPYLAVPKGDMDSAIKVLKLDPDNIIDKRTKEKPFRSRLKFTGTLYTGGGQIVDGSPTQNQRRLVSEFLTNPHGFLKAPARSGKTLLGVYIICALGQRAIVCGAEREWLRQFLKEFKEQTNLLELRKKTGRRIVGIVKHVSEITDDLDVVLVTYQKFIRGKEGLRRIKKYIHGNFATSVVDEAHMTAARAYSNVAANLDAFYSLALTATIERKDGLERLTRLILGPMITEGEEIGLVPDVEVIDTKLSPKHDWKGGNAAYGRAITWLSFNKKLNKLIVKNVFRDLRDDPKRKVIIPVARVRHAILLAKLINRQAQYNNENKGEKWSVNLAVPYHGKGQRDKVLHLMRESKKTRVLVAMKQMCTMALNIKPLSNMHLIIPMNNAPNFYQITKRICTPFQDKPTPKLSMYVHDFGLSRGCFRATWWNGIMANKYRVSRMQRDRANLLMNDGRGGRPSASKHSAPQGFNGPVVQKLW